MRARSVVLVDSAGRADAVVVVQEYAPVDRSSVHASTGAAAAAGTARRNVRTAAVIAPRTEMPGGRRATFMATGPPRVTLLPLMSPLRSALQAAAQTAQT